MKSFQNFIIENLNENLQDYTFYHVSPGPFPKLMLYRYSRQEGGVLLFFSLNIEDSYAWYKNSLNKGNSNSQIIKCVLSKSCKLTHIDDVNELTPSEKKSWVEMAVSNPNYKEFSKHPVTKKLKKMGINGVQIEDYDPGDFSKDLDSFVLFNFSPEEHIEYWESIKIDPKKL